MSPRISLFQRRVASLLGALALAGFMTQVAAQPVATIPDAPTIAPAPIMEKPLAPPATETMEAQPSAQHVWLPGHWRWQEGAYVWVGGHWEVPPAANVVWIAPRWEQKQNGFVLVEGFWQQTANTPAPRTTVTAPVQPQVVPQQSPQVVYAPQPEQPPQVVIVQQAPPEQVVREVIVERPGRDYVWIDGYWGWDRGRHVWVSGHWARPPRSDVVWEPARWEHRSNGYVLIGGSWRNVSVGVGVSVGDDRRGPPGREVVVVRPSAPSPSYVYVREAPPPPRREYYNERNRPSPRHVWVSGYWAWRGRGYEWISGRWEEPPRGRGRWEPAHWDRRDGGYILIEGSWR